MDTSKYLLTDSEVAEILHLSPQTLRMQRCRNIGIPFIRFGNKTVRYDPKDVMEYIEKNRKYPKEDHPNETKSK